MKLFIYLSFAAFIFSVSDSSAYCIAPDSIRILVLENRGKSIKAYWPGMPVSFSTLSETNIISGYIHSLAYGKISVWLPDQSIKTYEIEKITKIFQAFTDKDRNSLVLQAQGLLPAAGILLFFGSMINGSGLLVATPVVKLISAGLILAGGTIFLLKRKHFRCSSSKTLKVMTYPFVAPDKPVKSPEP